MRLIHISDLHVSMSSLGRLNWLLESIAAARPDHLVITGDLAAAALADELAVLKGLLDRHGFTDSDRLTVVPGNHDLFRFIYSYFESPRAVLGNPRTLRGLATTVRTLWAFRREVQAYNLDRYHDELMRFRTHFSAAFEGHITVPDSVCGFPFAKLLPDGCAIIGVNSNHYLPKLVSLFNLARFAPHVIRTSNISRIGQNLSGSTGFVHVESLQALLDLPELRERRKFLAMHHYLYDDHAIGNSMHAHTMHEMRLVNRQQVLELIRDYRIEMVLHGHWHVMDRYRVGQATILNAGGAIRSGYNLIDTHVKPMRIVVGGTATLPPQRVRRLSG